MRVRPIRRSALIGELVERILSQFPGRARILVDGAPPTEPGQLADALAEALRVVGRPALRVRAADFPRPASVRLERGRTDPDELLDRWLDVGGLAREVLDPAGPEGSGQVLPRLWDSRIDRAYRDERVALPGNGVVVLDGTFLLGRWLPAELTVHLRMSPTVLARRLDPAWHWSLPAYARYAAEHDPQSADVLVYADDPTRPAIVER